MHYAQGDVLLRRLSHTTPSIDNTVPVVLAEGEGSGHLHRLHAPFGGAVMFMPTEGSGGLSLGKLVVSGGKAKLKHEYADGTPTGDHGTIDIPSGTYEVIGQREFDEDEKVVRAVD